MIDLDLGKLILLGLIALVVLGPEKLPVAARTVGAIMRRMRSGWSDVRAEVEREVQIADIKRVARDVSQQLASSQAGLNAAVGQFRTALDSAALNTPMLSTPADGGPAIETPMPESPSQRPLSLIPAAAFPGATSAHDHAAEDVPHDVT